MALIAAILALLIVYVLSTITLNENKKNTGILKMLGYREGNIFKIILGFNYVSFYNNKSLHTKQMYGIIKSIVNFKSGVWFCNEDSNYFFSPKSCAHSEMGGW